MKFMFDRNDLNHIQFSRIRKAEITYIGSDVTESVVGVRLAAEGVWVLFPLSETRTDVCALSFVPWTAIGAIDVHEVD